MSILNIAIPTFNRPEFLKKLVSSLDDALAGDYSKVSVSIFDNASDIPVNSYIYNKNITIYRNRFNIGAVGNILKCFEQSKSDWLWIVGDDDNVSFEGISNCLNEIEGHPNASTIYFSNKHGVIKDNVVTHSVDEFLSQYSFENFGGRLWISSQIYNLQFASKVLRYMYAFPSSSPQMIWGLMLADSQITFSNKENAIHTQANEDEHWHPDNVINQMIQSLSMPLDDRLRSRMGFILGNWFYRFDQSLAKLIHFHGNGHADYPHLEFAFFQRYANVLLSTGQFKELASIIPIFEAIKNKNFNVDIANIIKNIKLIHLPSNKKFIDNI